ncbi:MAG: Rho termination factor N-terminal domain-containing protein [Opitutales bacterium]
MSNSKSYEQKYTKPKLREQLKEDIKASDKGGKPGQWSARKSQMLVQEYEKHGGGYEQPGKKDASQRSLEQWTEEAWQTIDGDAHARRGDGTVKRYLPKKAWEQLSDKEKRDTDRMKRVASQRGQQYVDNTQAAKQARSKVKEAEQDGGLREKTKQELNALASDFEIRGRSKMTKDELVHALHMAAAPGQSSHRRSG